MQKYAMNSTAHDVLLQQPTQFRRVSRILLLIVLLVSARADAFSGASSKATNYVSKVIRSVNFDAITGHVIDEKGEALQGVSVVVKGSTSGTTTDASGTFTINANKGDILVFSGIGYYEQEVPVSDNALNIVMKSLVGQMDEVVVVGYGTTTRKATTSSISTIDVAKVAALPTQSISDGLQGRVSGGIMTASGGSPGRKAQIYVRGADRAPLFVIDGVIRSQNDFENLNPNDIADMSVLKDASATAVYGSTGANGAVLVTTKKGTAGKPLISY